MSQHLTNLGGFFKDRTGYANATKPVNQTKHQLNARVGEARGSIHLYNSKDVNVNNDFKSGNEYRGVISRTWVLSNPQKYAPF